jgi:hypothetical protein
VAWKIPIERLQGQTDAVFKTDPVYQNEFKRYFGNSQLPLNEKTLILIEVEDENPDDYQ